MLLDPANCNSILEAIRYQTDSLVRLWMRTVSGIYPTAARLHRMFPGKYPSPICPRCQLQVPETLNHFVTTCPHYRRARTEAHNRCWAAIMQRVVTAAPPGWQFYHDQPLSNTGLRLVLPVSPVSDGSRQAAGQAPDFREGPDPRNLWLWRPDAVAVNEAQRKIAILEHCRPFDGDDVEMVGTSQPDPGGGGDCAQGREPPSRRRSRTEGQSDGEDDSRRAPDEGRCQQQAEG